MYTQPDTAAGNSQGHDEYKDAYNRSLSSG